MGLKLTSILYILLQIYSELLSSKFIKPQSRSRKIIYKRKKRKKKKKEKREGPILEARGYTPVSAQIPRLTYRSAPEIFLRTSTNNTTAKSATSSEKRFGALAMAMPRRRHSGKSMWSRPTLEVTIRPRKGSRRRIPAVILGSLVEVTRARKEPPWVVKNWSRGISELHSHALR
ncbi:hypothetical protein TorRG33x02_190030 [Trema orientale]|uniref:Uncharacterized protein n=1 Tax=Trema orientale TaxID=63057 RepID=A0A2P5EI06_TREOI|nr:hypothetical protein TorRG33x02_190030 [Trema orientale]